ncbi:hypothetical protein [Halomonas maura]|uniref:hypothetical protein n=1 Tax=Halomonas maura TaxID=117606 RepID=UPI0025B2C780|nr:hypothetical protein [Halomonas maura]MDN3555526.1 hypothetical protein [Halomonas maura]
MSDRSYEEAADEFEELNFFQSVSRFSHCFSELSLGELMAMGGRFLELAHGDAEVEDERETSRFLAAAIEEVIVFRLRGNEDGLQKYLAAKQAHLEYLQQNIPHASDRDTASPKPSSSTKRGLFAWFGGRR